MGASADADVIVGAPGNTANVFPFVVYNGEYQQAYAAADFSGPITISGLSFFAFGPQGSIVSIQGTFQLSRVVCGGRLPKNRGSGLLPCSEVSCGLHQRIFKRDGHPPGIGSLWRGTTMIDIDSNATWAGGGYSENSKQPISDRGGSGPRQNFPKNKLKNFCRN
jgi:hypothetical protein